MKINTLITLVCSFFVSKLSADSSHTSPGSATSALEETIECGALDVRQLLGKQLNVDASSLEITWGGMNASGTMWGGIVVDRTRTDGFVLSSDGTLKVYASTNVEGRGDIPVPRSTVILGVSAAGEVAYSQGYQSFVSYPSGVQQVFEVEGTSWAQPLGIDEYGSVSYMAERDGVSVFGYVRAGVVDECVIDTMNNSYAGYQGQGTIAGAQFANGSSGYSAYIVASGELVNPFSGTTAQVVDVTSGGILGVRHQYDDSWGYSVFVESPGNAWVSNGATHIEGVVRQGSVVTVLQSNAAYSIPFALSSDGLKVVGTVFEDIQNYSEYGNGSFAVWHNGVQQEVRIETEIGIQVRDGVGISDSGVMVAKTVSGDGEQAFSLVVPRSNLLRSHETVSPTADVGSLVVIGEHGFESSEGVSFEGKRVVVLSHGWAPGYKDAVQDNPELRAWDANATWYQEVAASLRAEDSEVVVLGYDWLEGAATESSLTPRISRSYASTAGYVLGMTLQDVVHDAVSIEMIGHSHGSRVVVAAAGALEEVGVSVSAITLMDSPESPASIVGAASAFSGGENLLAGDLAAYAMRFGIGDGATDTQIINVYSNIGEAYVLPGVTNVQLVAYTGIQEGHSYPLTWFAQGGRVIADGGTYVEDSQTHLLVRVGDGVEYVAAMSQQNGGPDVSSVQNSKNETFSSLAVVHSLDARQSLAGTSLLCLTTEDGIWDALLALPEGVESIMIPYLFSATDDSYLSAWFGEENVGFVFAGTSNYAAVAHSGENDDGWRSMLIPVGSTSGLVPFGIGFRGEGTVTIGEIEIISSIGSVGVAPEPQRAVLFLLGLIAVVVPRRRSCVC